MAYAIRPLINFTEEIRRRRLSPRGLLDRNDL